MGKYDNLILDDCIVRDMNNGFVAEVKNKNPKVKVIETNLIVHDGEIKDHQSKVIECNSWEEYVNAYENYNGEAVEFKSLTHMFGCSIPKSATIENLVYDEYHLSCDIICWNGKTDRHLAYKE